MMVKALTNFVKRYVPRPIIDHLIYLIFYKFIKRNYFAQNNLDKKLTKYIGYKNGFFVELGANDGFTASNTLHYEIKYNWRGILIEPSPNLFLSCAHYRNKPGNSIYCNACVPFNFDSKYVDIEYAYLMSVSANLESDIVDKQKFLNDARQNFNNYQKGLKFGAVARTLSSILDESNAPLEIDLLSLDVEGSELDVLKGVDFEKYQFKFLLVECRNISRLSKFLEEKNYTIIDQLSHHDYLFSYSKATNIN